MKDMSWPGRKYFQNISDKDLVYRIKKKKNSHNSTITPVWEVGCGPEVYCWEIDTLSFPCEGGWGTISNTGSQEVLSLPDAHPKSWRGQQRISILLLQFETFLLVSENRGGKPGTRASMLMQSKSWIELEQVAYVCQWHAGSRREAAVMSLRCLPFLRHHSAVHPSSLAAMALDLQS